MSYQNSGIPQHAIRYAFDGGTDTTVTTSAWTELEDSLPATASAVHIYNGAATSTFQLAIGPAGSEASNIIPFFITPGMDTRMNFTLPEGVRLAIKAVDVDASASDLILNFFG